MYKNKKMNMLFVENETSSNISPYDIDFVSDTATLPDLWSINMDIIMSNMNVHSSTNDNNWCISPNNTLATTCGGDATSTSNPNSNTTYSNDLKFNSGDDRTPLMHTRVSESSSVEKRLSDGKVVIIGGNVSDINGH